MFQIAIDTDTMPVSPAVYADEYRGRALPTVLPLVQGFRGNLRVYFLGEHAPSENAAVALYLRALQSKEKLVQTGLGTRGISDAGNVYYDVPLAADTTALSAVLGNRENVIMRAGIVANDVTASPQTNFEWQLNIAVSASAIGTGEKPPVSPNAIEEHNNDVAAHPFILQKIAAAEVDVSGLRTSIAGVSESLNATNTNLNNAKSELSTEISEVAAALNAETIARENEDAAIRAALGSEVFARESQGGSISEALTSERSERESEDASIRTELDLRVKCVFETALHASDEEMACRIAADSSEKTCRKAADSEINVKVQNLCTGFTSVSSSVGMQSTIISNLCSEVYEKIASERTCRTNADNALRGSINTLNSDVAAIEGNIQTLENNVVSTSEALTEHTKNTNPHWSVDEENNLIRKEVVDGKGLAIVSKDECSCFGIFFMPTCVCFSPNGSFIEFSRDGCIAIKSNMFYAGNRLGSESISISDSLVSLSVGYGGGISISDMGVSISGRGISLLSCGNGEISLSLGCDKSILFKGAYGGYIALKEEGNGDFALIQQNVHCQEYSKYLLNIDNFDAIKFSSKNYNNEIGNYAFCATAVSLCRSGGNVLQGNSSQTALYFGTTAFATSKIDSGSRVVCFGNPLGKVNIKAGNGGRIDICATCVYVNGVKIST